MIELTERQKMVYDFIRDFIKEKEFPPTIREVGDRFKISVKGAFDHIEAIERKGYIRRYPGARAIRILKHV